LWLPRKIETEIFVDRLQAEHDPRPIHRSVIDLTELHANDVDDELFSIQIPDGVLVHDFTRGEKSPDGINTARSYYQTIENKVADQTGFHFPYVLWYIECALLAIMGGLAILFRKKRSQDSK
jgi:hypothetical protein